ncbi:MAG: hypothetical protein VKI82_14630 [Leptolyngbya sp.]|nr:hypothetical protein [Leptolyngbya sp.]
MKRLILGVLWLGFVGYGVWFAPADQPDTAALILRLSTGQWDGLNPWVADKRFCTGRRSIAPYRIRAMSGSGDLTLTTPGFAVVTRL